MRVASLTAYIVKLPLRREIKHASATRRESTNLLIRCRLTDGTEGWGEGVPRSYVTGETPEGALRQLTDTPLAEQLDVDCQSWRDVIGICEGFRPSVAHDDPRGCGGHALRCAVELSILDAFGRLFEEPLSAVVREFAPAGQVQESHGEIHYSTMITGESWRAERLNALKMRLYGFQQCKVKVGIDGTDDEQRLGRIRWWLGRAVDLRLDANEAWQPGEVCAKIDPLLEFNVSCIEQPVPHEEVGALPEVREQLRVPIMLDESLTSMTDAEQAIRSQSCDLFNIRLSKCGGFLNSLRIAGRAREAGIGYQLGCHPGESGILSAAGRHWATSVRDIRYLEGSYDRHLLQQLLTNEDITFGYGGRAPALTRPGLGVTINSSVLSRLTLREETYRLE